MTSTRRSAGESQRSAVSIHGRSQTVIGTGAVIAPNLVVTALHVIDPEPTSALRVADQFPVAASASLPLRRFGPARNLARVSYERARDLCGVDIGTVDLALLVVPTMRGTPLKIRPTPVERDDYVIVPGFPMGRWSVTAGPVTSRDDADFVAHVLIGAGVSGAPALDPEGYLAGIATMDHASAGGIFIGPELLTVFIERTQRLVAGIGARP